MSKEKTQKQFEVWMSAKWLYYKLYPMDVDGIDIWDRQKKWKETYLYRVWETYWDRLKGEGS